jgi:hypothetical protein
MALAAALLAPAIGSRPLEPVEREEELNLRPLIGIVSQGGDPAPEGHSYLAASYVKFVEAAGGRAVPILHDMSKQEVMALVAHAVLKFTCRLARWHRSCQPPRSSPRCSPQVARRFRAVNAVLLPGGAQDLRPGNPYFDTSALLYKLAVESNDRGDYFPVRRACNEPAAAAPPPPPCRLLARYFSAELVLRGRCLLQIHATCLGFEALAVIASGNTSILSRFDAEDYAQPLLPTEKAANRWGRQHARGARSFGCSSRTCRIFLRAACCLLKCRRPPLRRPQPILLLTAAPRGRQPLHPPLCHAKPRARPLLARLQGEPRPGGGLRRAHAQRRPGRRRLRVHYGGQALPVHRHAVASDSAAAPLLCSNAAPLRFLGFI